MGRMVPLTGGEKESLHVSLDRLDDEQLRRPMTPSGTNLLGLVKHLASVEFGWFGDTFGRPSESIPFDEANPEADMPAGPDETTADIVAYYGRARTAADQAVAELDLDHQGTAWFGSAVSMRWVLVHMIEETARHAGHMDIVREQIDGATGALPPD